MATLDSIKTEPIKLETQIQDQYQFNADISNVKMDLDDVVVTGYELMKHCQGEDVAKLQNKLEDMKDRYVFSC